VSAAARRPGHSTFHDLLDNQVVGSDGVPVGRVADVRGTWREDGRLLLTALVFGPQALVGRISSRAQPLARRLLRDRFDHEISIREVREMGETVVLRRPAAEYEVGRRVEEWIAHHLLRRLSLFRY
jgi:sporulation protein YlmC with PRC-barrel domain